MLPKHEGHTDLDSLVLGVLAQLLLLSTGESETAIMLPILPRFNA